MSRAVLPSAMALAALCLCRLAAAQEGTDPAQPEVPRFEQPPAEPPSEPPPAPPVEVPPSELPAPEEPAAPPGERRPTRVYQDEDGVSVISNRENDEPAPLRSADAAPPAAAPSEPMAEPPAPSDEPAPLPSAR